MCEHLSSYDTYTMILLLPIPSLCRITLYDHLDHLTSMRYTTTFPYDDLLDSLIYHSTLPVGISTTYAHDMRDSSNTTFLLDTIEDVC